MTRSKVPAPAKVSELLKPAYKGKVASTATRPKTGAAFSGVVMAAIQPEGAGTAGDISKECRLLQIAEGCRQLPAVDPTSA